MPSKFNYLIKKLCALSMLIFCMFTANAQKTISGRIINNVDKQPIASATITVKNTSTATQTANDGTFSIQVPQDNSILTISVVGYEQLEISTTGKTQLGDIALTSITASLNDIVVTGYTSQRVKDITGSVAVVSVANMKQTPSGSTEGLLQGQASGVTVFTTGAPGGASVVQIRGITSSGNSSPLIIVDGVPSSMHDINPNDIQSIQVLKDAGAAAIYGVRGSNGVIIITTRKGSGAVKINYDAYYGEQLRLSKSWDLASPTQTGIAKWAQAFNDGIAPSDPQYGSGSTPVVPYYITPTGAPQGAPNTSLADYNLYDNHITPAAQNGNNWFNDIFHSSAPIMNHNISVSGGSGKSSYYMSFNYMDQQGTLIETSLKRYSLRFNSSFSLINDHLRIGENAYAFYKTNPGYLNAPGVNSTNAINAAYGIPNIIPVHDIVGNYAGTISQGLGNQWNPVAIQDRQSHNKNNDYQINGNIFADVDVLKNFTAHTSVGGTIDYNFISAFASTPYENAENNHNANFYLEQYGWNSSMVWTNTLNYASKIGKHNISATAGSEYIYNSGRAVQTTRGNYYITDSSNLTVQPNLWTLNFGQASTQTNANVVGDNGIATPYQLAIFSLFGRVDYNYDQKYYLSGTFRRDGSSVFVPAQRYGNFPSVTGGWRISQESFMKNVKWLNELKIRGGWGKLGSISNINPTNAYTLYGQVINRSYYDINGTSSSPEAGLYVSQYGNPNTTWEEDIISNVGIDASILNGKFDFTIEYYKKMISGLLFQPLAPGTNGGAADPFINSGDVENKGIDAAITYHGQIKKDFRFDVTGTFTSYNNKVVSLPAGTKYIDVGSNGSNTIFSRIQPGQALGAFFGYKIIGLFQNYADVDKSPTQQDAAPGRFKYDDVNHDGVIDNNDRTFFGNPNPKFTAGLNLSANYKGFDFYMFIYSSVGNDILNQVKGSTDFPQGFGNQISENVAVNSARLVNASGQPTNVNDQTAQVANSGTTVPMLEKSANFSNSAVFNSYTMENGSFVRCRNLTVGYTIASNALSRLHFDRLRIYVQALNLFTITNYSGLDPELNPGSNTLFGLDGGVYPNNQKSFNIGINATLH
ncbi:MAG TPA: SusC/RagA family TonB-linked outer membrane protein [Parafilimonas sp.]